MLSTPSTTEPTPEDVQEQMRDTRAHMSGQMQALEDKVTGMAQDAADAVDGGASESALASVRHALDVRRHVRRHPWLAMGTAAALGFVCARCFGRR
jgi:ElaB/YqjD/DUF883 family membrane-anchored ribosome-binding protein